MTTIKLALKDQRLFALNKVTLASGDINSVQLEVEFCEAWDEYPVRFAHFAVQTADRLILSSETDTLPDVLMIDNKAIVPATALAESGVLYIGVYGDNLDGTARKTSTGELKLVIHKGASGAKTTIAPEADAFMQYLAAMDAKIDPLMTAAIEQMKATMTAHHEALSAVFAEQLEDLKDYVKGDVLWQSTIEDEIKAIVNRAYNDGDPVESRRTVINYSFDASKYCRFTAVFAAGGSAKMPISTPNYSATPHRNGDITEVTVNDVRWRVGDIVKDEPHPVLYTSRNVNRYDSGWSGTKIEIYDEFITVGEKGALKKVDIIHLGTGTVAVAPVLVAIIGYKDPMYVELPDIEFE